MKLHYKLLAAAVAMAAATGANAAIDNGTVSGNGELFLVVNDYTAGYSFVGDLGISMDSFLANNGTNHSWTLASFTSWAPFVSTIGGSLANATYAVYAFDANSALTGTNQLRLLTTSATYDDVSSDGVRNGQLANALGTSITTQWLQNAVQVDSSNTMNDHDTLANGSSFGNTTPGSFAGNAIGDDLAANMPFYTTNLITDQASFWLLGNNGSSIVGAVNTELQPGVFSVSAGSLDYTAAPVPVPAAVWLLGSGLMGLAGVGRRRKV